MVACPTCGCTCGGQLAAVNVSVGETVKYVQGWQGQVREEYKDENMSSGQKHTSPGLGDAIMASSSFIQKEFTQVRKKTNILGDANPDSQIPLFLQKTTHHGEPVIRTPDPLEPRKPLRKILQTLPQSYNSHNFSGDEFVTMESLLSNTDTPSSSKFVFPPPLAAPQHAHVSNYPSPPPPFNNYPAPPPVSSHYSTPPPSSPSTELSGLVHSLSSPNVSIDTKKKSLLSLIQRSFTETESYQIMSGDMGDLLAGVKCVLNQFKDSNTNFRKEVLVLALTCLNRCLAFSKTSARLRSLMWNRSREVTASTVGELSFIQSLVTLCDPGDGRLSPQLCSEVTSELRSLPLGVVIGRCSHSLESADQVGKWLGLSFGIRRQDEASMKVLQDMYKVMDLSLVQGGQEMRLDKLLAEKYPGSMWAVRHPVRDEVGADWTTVSIVRLLSTGHVLAYIDMQWQERLSRLDQELQEGYRLELPRLEVKVSSLVCVKWEDVQLCRDELPPLVRCYLARAMVLAIKADGNVEVLLLDHGCKVVTSSKNLSPLPAHLTSLNPILLLSKLQGVLPSPDTSLLSPCLQALSHICNSRTVFSLLNRPSLSTPRILSQLVSSPDISMSTPALTVLYTLASKEESRKHLLLSPVCMQLVIPSLTSLLSLPTLPSAQLPTTLETLLLLCSHSPPDKVAGFYCDGTLVDSLMLVKNRLGESPYAGLVDKIIQLGGSSVRTTSLPSVSSANLNNNIEENEQDMKMGGITLESMLQGLQVGKGVGKVDNWKKEQERIAEDEAEKLKEQSMRIYNDHIAKTSIENTKSNLNQFIPLQVQSRAIRTDISPPLVSDLPTTTISDQPTTSTSDLPTTTSDPSTQTTPTLIASSSLPSWLASNHEDDDSSDSDEDSPVASPLGSFQDRLGSNTKIVKDKLTIPISSAESISSNLGGLPPWLAPGSGSSVRESNVSPGGEGLSGTESGLEDAAELGNLTLNDEEELSPWPKVSQVQEVVTLGHRLSEQEGLGVEFWEMERLALLCPSTLAVLLCGMLNSGGGVVWVGVDREGVVRGVKTGRGERDKTRQMLDRVCSTSINPRVGPRIVDIDFVKVEGGNELWLIKFSVRVEEEVLYRVRNLGNRKFSEGVYVRKETGPTFTEFVSEEMLQCVEGLGNQH